MDVGKFVENLTLQQKAKLTHGNGWWHTNAINDLPQIMMTDGPHGLRKQTDTNKGINDSARATCFPTASALASSWNRRNLQAVAEGIANEAIAENVSVVLGPGVNVKRSPLCGRNFEYFSEDPYLAGELASAYVSSMQSKGVGCSLKHFAVNSQETGRMTTNAIVDERALREIYLAAFERVVKQSQPYTIMASYNKINGVSSALNKRLLTDILRSEWGYQGLVLSDWGATYDMAQAYQAGLDLEMPDGGAFHEQMTVRAVQDGTLDEAHLDRACANVAKLVDKCTTFPRDVQPVDYAHHHELCRQIAADSAVLLKNKGILPLHKNQKLLVVGELAEKPRFQGSGSSHVNATCKSFLQVLDDNGVQYTYARGYSVNGDNINAEWESEAAKLALKHDTVLFFGGLTDDFEGEGADRVKLDIPECQQSLLKTLARHNPNVVFVAFGGSPFVMPWIGNVKALLHMYLGGEAVTEAAYDLVYGNVSPSGRLAETYPMALHDTPCYNYYGSDVHLDEHRESIFVGYRYYNTFGVPVQFPFGYGLSYSHFEYNNLTVNSVDEGYDVTVTVKNIGSIPASEVVQVYVDNCACGYMRAKRQLAGFDKVHLQSGESRDVIIHLDSRAFSIFVDGSFKQVKGKYKVSVRANVERPILVKEVEVDGVELRGQDRKLYPCYFETRELETAHGSWIIDEQQFYALAKVDKQEYQAPKRGQFTLLNTLEDLAPSVRLVRSMLKIVKKIAIKQSPTKSITHPEAQMFYSGATQTPLISLISLGGIPAKYVLYILHHSNRKYFKALGALFGRVKLN